MRKQGFILIETLLALVLSAGIIVSMLNTYNNADKIMRKMNAILRLNKNACLLFNQIERDISTAIVGPFSVNDAKKNEQKQDAKMSTEKDKPIQFFHASSYGDITRKKENYVMKMLRSLSIINSNPFLVYNEPKVRLVRLFYELTALKKNVKDPKEQRYDFYRSETYDLANTEAKLNTKSKKKDENEIPILKYCLCKNIVSLFIFYHFPPDKKKEINKETSAADQSKRAQTAQLPAIIDIECTIEDHLSGIQATYTASFPTIASTEIEKKEEQPAKQQPNKPTGQPQKQNNATAQSRLGAAPLRR
ncbi:hypothetical protein JKY79_02780 [Candidatus Babeliales bacterium]|nr:hypothetical protein [Candidatus Babeliales bacterium]